MTAATTASGIQPGEVVPWGALERSAFEDFPEVVSELRAAVVGGRSGRGALYLVPLGILIAVIYASPIWGVATVVGPWALSQTSRTAQGDITVAGVIFIVGFVALLAHFVIWLVGGRSAGNALLGSAAMSLALGGISAAVTVMRGNDEAVPGWGLWVLPMVASALAGAIIILAVPRMRRRVTKPETPQGSRLSQHDLELVRASVARVSDEDQRAIRTDLAVAIDDLLLREVISQAEASTAQAAQLGELAGAMASARVRG